MVKFWWMLFISVEIVSASINDLRDSTLEKDSRFLVPLFPKRYDRRPPPPPPPSPSAPLAGPRCSARLESALDDIKRRRSQPKTLDSPSSHTIELSGYSLQQAMRAAPLDMHVTRMRVRLPPHGNWVRVERCVFDPRNTSLDTMLLFNDLTISGNVDLGGADRGRAAPGGSGCNMILRLRKAGIGFHTRPLDREPGRFNVKTDSEFVEPGFISVYGYGCERYVARARLPRRRRRSADLFSFEPRLGQAAGWAAGEGNGRPGARSYRPDELDDAEEISREMEDIFSRGIRTLLTTYMKKELQPAIKETLMRNMGYVISYG